jgi:L-alanine-DL-glutamate epimerase-like enolase superfamily enzyme
MKLELEPATLHFAEPLLTADGELRERRTLLVKLTGEDGVSGFGESAPLEPYDGVSLERAERALRRHAAALTGAGATTGVGALDACRGADPLPQALAAVDIALWDMAGQRAGRSVATLLSDEPPARVPVNATVAARDRAGAAEQAARAAQEGFGCIKVKVGVGDDAGRVAAVRAAAGHAMALRLDANGAWNVEHAVAEIGALSPAGLELVEEPVHGIDAMRRVRERVAVRVAIDETAAETGALSARCADAVCLKIGRCGGISGLLAAAALVRATEADVYLASSFDGPLGVAAAVHAAAALASRGPLLHCGLATLRLFADADQAALPVLDGAIATPAGAGLGVRP